MCFSTTRFDGKTVAISGAAGGIGSAAAAYFSRLGARTLLIDRDAEALARITTHLSLANSVALVCDQARDEDIARTCASAAQADIFINNAGVTHRAALLDTTPADIRRVLDINVTGAMSMAIGMAAHMAERGRGTIINVTSQFSMIPAPGRAVYGASKAALAHFTRSAAQEWGPAGITVVGLAPGPVDTPMLDSLRRNPQGLQRLMDQLPTGRMSHPDEVAAALGFLARCAPGAMNGETLLADGGFMLRESIFGT